MGEYHEHICCIKEKLAEAAYSAMNGGLDCVDTHELGEVVDMIKDLGEYERDHYQACYYKSAVNAMKYGNERRGYMYPTYPDEDLERDSRWMGPMNDWDDDYGHKWREYKSAKRHYTETHSNMDKSRMETNATEHMHNMMDSVKQIWADADPELRQKIKDDMTRFANELM